MVNRLRVEKPTEQANRVKMLQEAIEAIAEHPTLDQNAKHRGITSLQLALERLTSRTSKQAVR
ncbi:MAG: hypothetical protein GX986_12000 [Firmicutes bacterium]|mgnify:CR=1 FL=1|nr:hypothetical protein [Bacillota bacterium]